MSQNQKAQAIQKSLRLFFNNYLNNNTANTNNIDENYRIYSSQLARHYKNHLSNYYNLQQFDHAGE